MRDSLNRSGGIFYPHEIDEMREELKRNDNPKETNSDREERAVAIIRRGRHQAEEAA